MSRQWSSDSVEPSQDFKERVGVVAKQANLPYFSMAFAVAATLSGALLLSGCTEQTPEEQAQATAEQQLSDARDQCISDNHEESECDKGSDVMQRLAANEPYKSQKDCEKAMGAGQCQQFAVGASGSWDNSAAQQSHVSATNSWLPYWIMMNSQNRGYYSAGNYDYRPVGPAPAARSGYTPPASAAFGSMARTSAFTSAMAPGRPATAVHAFSTSGRSGGFGVTGSSHGSFGG